MANIRNIHNCPLQNILLANPNTYNLDENFKRIKAHVANCSSAPSKPMGCAENEIGIGLLALT